MIPPHSMQSGFLYVKIAIATQYRVCMAYLAVLVAALLIVDGVHIRHLEEPTVVGLHLGVQVTPLKPPVGAFFSIF